MNANGELSITAVQFDSPVVERLLSHWDDELRARIPGFSPGGGSTVAPADFATPAGVFLVAMLRGRPVGCGGLRRLNGRAGEIKRLFVRSQARGHGVGRALLLALEQRARALGYTMIRLDTHAGEHPAVELFRSAGYREIADYNRNPYASYWFEKQLV